MTSLKAGDIVWADFDPVRGSEQGRVRPAIVLTTAEFHDASTKAIVCPHYTEPHTVADQGRTAGRHENEGFRAGGPDSHAASTGARLPLHRNRARRGARHCAAHHRRTARHHAQLTSRLSHTGRWSKRSRGMEVDRRLSIT